MASSTVSMLCIFLFSAIPKLFQGSVFDLNELYFILSSNRAIMIAHYMYV